MANIPELFEEFAKSIDACNRLADSLIQSEPGDEWDERERKRTLTMLSDATRVDDYLQRIEELYERKECTPPGEFSLESRPRAPETQVEPQAKGKNKSVISSPQSKNIKKEIVVIETVTFSDDAEEQGTSDAILRYDYLGNQINKQDN